MFLLTILRVDPVQNLAEYKKWSCVFIQLTNRSIVIKFKHNIVMNELRIKDVQGQGPANTNLSVFVCFFDVYIIFITLL